MRMDDPRIEAILDHLLQLAAGKLDTYSPHSGAGDELDAIIESINMLTEELCGAFKELKEVNDRLLRSEKLTVLGQLCGGVAHELRNPLGALKNASYFLGMALPEADAEVQETLGIIDKEVGNCERLIGNLLDFACPKLGSQVKVEINHLFTQVLAGMHLPDSVEIVRQLGTVLPDVDADPETLAQVLSNIILNAVQSMPLGGRVVLGSRTDEPGWISISVADTGCGIRPEDLERIFEPLYTTKARGIGLGLAVSRSIVEAHGGAIEVDSMPEKGTTITIRLPCRV